MATKEQNTADVVTYTFNVSQDKKASDAGRTDSVSMTFDFAGVTRGQLMTEAMRAIAIRIQSQMRALPSRKENPVKWPDVVKSFNGKKVSVAAALTGTRVRTTPVQKVSKLAEGKSAAEIAAMVAELQRSLKGNKTANK